MFDIQYIDCLIFLFFLCVWSESIWQFSLEINHCTLPVLSEHGTLHFRDYGAQVIVGLRTSEEVLNYLSLIVTVMSE